MPTSARRNEEEGGAPAPPSRPSLTPDGGVLVRVLKPVKRFQADHIVGGTGREETRAQGETIQLKPEILEPYLANKHVEIVRVSRKKED